MRHKIAILLLGAFSISLPCHSEGQPISAMQYIELYKDMAIANMKEMGVPASITLAQGMLESGNGNSRLARQGNNHFGIKCHSDWDGPRIHEDDDEKRECFRKYKSVQDSYRDHAEFLKTKQRYAFLFALEITDYKGWANGLKQAGYATNPQYATRLIHIIEEHALYQFDSEGEPIAGNVKTDKDKTANGDKTQRRKKHRQNRQDRIPTELELSAKRDVRTENNTPFVVARKGDTFFKIASEYEMEIWQLYKYNDMGRNDVLKEGDRIYLKPKKRTAAAGKHSVSEGETWQGIAQLYGVKLKHLLRYNQGDLSKQPEKGKVLWLKRPDNRGG